MASGGRSGSGSARRRPPSRAGGSGGAGGGRAAASIGGPSADDYWSLSASPLHSLVMLVPLVILYEIGAVLSLRAVRTEVLADKLMGEFLRLFGLVGLLLPAVAMLGVLLLMHIVRGDRWRVRPVVVLGMALEASLWALPLVVFGQLMLQAPLVAGAAAGGGGAGVASLMDLTVSQRATIALGAGLYEEFLFRLVCIALVHLVAHDVFKLSERVAGVLAVVVSAGLFAAYHPGVFAGGLNLPLAGFYLMAGVFFAVVYLTRGFGIAVGAHAAYDLIVLRVVG